MPTSILPPKAAVATMPASWLLPERVPAVSPCPPEPPSQTVLRRPAHTESGYDSNEMGGYFRVVRAWLPMRFEKHNETQNNSSRDNGNAKLANRFGSGVLREFQFHRASSGEKKEPKSECKQGRQAGIHDYWRRERFFQVNRQQ